MFFILCVYVATYQYILHHRENKSIYPSGGVMFLHTVSRNFETSEEFIKENKNGASKGPMQTLILNSLDVKKSKCAPNF